MKRIIKFLLVALLPITVASVSAQPGGSPGGGATWYSTHAMATSVFLATGDMSDDASEYDIDFDSFF